MLDAVYLAGGEARQIKDKIVAHLQGVVSRAAVQAGKIGTVNDAVVSDGIPKAQNIIPRAAIEVVLPGTCGGGHQGIVARAAHKRGMAVLGGQGFTAVAGLHQFVHILVNLHGFALVIGIGVIAAAGAGVGPGAMQAEAVSGVAVHAQGSLPQVGDGGCVQVQMIAAVAGKINGADAADLARA